MLHSTSTALASQRRRASPFEPDAVWKQDLKNRIFGRLAGMIEEAKLLHEEYVRKRPEARVELDKDFQRVMNVVDNMVEETYCRELELERDRRERTMIAGEGLMKGFEQEQSLLDMILNSGEVSPALSQSDSVEEPKRKSLMPTNHSSPIHHKPQLSSKTLSSNEEPFCSDSVLDGKYDLQVAARWKEQILHRNRLSLRNFTGASADLSDTPGAHTCPLTPSLNETYEVWIPSFRFEGTAASSRYGQLNVGHTGASLPHPSPPFTFHDVQTCISSLNTRSVGTSRVEQDCQSYKRWSGDSSPSPSASLSAPPCRPPTPPFHTKPTFRRPSVMSGGVAASEQSLTTPNNLSPAIAGESYVVTPASTATNAGTAIAAVQQTQSMTGTETSSCPTVVSTYSDTNTSLAFYQPQSHHQAGKQSSNIDIPGRSPSGYSEPSGHSSPKFSTPPLLSESPRQIDQEDIPPAPQQAWRMWFTSELHQRLKTMSMSSQQGHSCPSRLEDDEWIQPDSEASVVSEYRRDVRGQRKDSEAADERQDVMEQVESPSKFPVMEDEDMIFSDVRNWKTNRIKDNVVDELAMQDNHLYRKLQYLATEEHKQAIENADSIGSDFYDAPLDVQVDQEEDLWGPSDLQRIEEELVQIEVTNTNGDGKTPQQKQTLTATTEEGREECTTGLDGPGPSKVDAVLKQLEWILGDKSRYQILSSQRGELAQSLLDLLQTLSDYPQLNARLRAKIFAALIRLSRKSKLYPSCLALNNIQRVGEYPVAGGGFGDIWKGLIGDQMACLKVVKVYGDSDVHLLLKEFLKEAILWRQLEHPNVLPFLGLYFLDECKQRVCLVSPWMENGNARQYLSKDSEQNVDRTVLVYDVANGLSYLHARKIVHGDLKAVNILITATGRALVADFGLSRLVDSGVLKWSSLSTKDRVGGTTRWLAPECLLRESPLTYKSDIYAFGCVCYEILTGLLPFHEIAQDPQVVFQLIHGKRPVRPLQIPRLTDVMWAMMEECWAEEPSDRPEAYALPDRISRFADQTMTCTEQWDDPIRFQLWSNLQHPELCPSASIVENFLFGSEFTYI